MAVPCATPVDCPKWRHRRPASGGRTRAAPDKRRQAAGRAESAIRPRRVRESRGHGGQCRGRSGGLGVQLDQRPQRLLPVAAQTGRRVGARTGHGVQFRERLRRTFAGLADALLGVVQRVVSLKARNVIAGRLVPRLVGGAHVGPFGLSAPPGHPPRRQDWSPFPDTQTFRPTRRRVSPTRVPFGSVTPFSVCCGWDKAPFTTHERSVSRTTGDFPHRGSGG